MKSLIIFCLLSAFSFSATAEENKTSSTSSSASGPRKAIEKLDHEMKKDLGQAKKDVNAEVCASGQEQCSVNTASGSATEKTTAPKTKKK